MSLIRRDLCTYLPDPRVYMLDLCAYLLNPRVYMLDLCVYMTDLCVYMFNSHMYMLDPRVYPSAAARYEPNLSRLRFPPRPIGSDMSVNVFDLFETVPDLRRPYRPVFAKKDFVDAPRAIGQDAGAMTNESNSNHSSEFLTIKQTAKWAAAIYVAALLVFGATMAERLSKPSPDNHYVYLADAMLHGRLAMEGKPPHRNDWAEYQGKWYVSFPPAPAVLMIPGVAAFGLSFNDRLFTLAFAAACPALLFLIIAALVRRRSIDRKPWEAALLCGLYGIGTVFYFGAVQGSVWYTAHMVGSFFLLLFILASLDGRHPILAGFCLISAFACRPPMLLAGLFFVFETLSARLDPSLGFFAALKAAIRTQWKALLLPCVRSLLLFAAPVAIIMGLLMWMNFARFDNPFEFGHGLLKVRWTGRIEKWGLFNYHYLARNLAVFGALLPWISPTAPHIQISNHGLALWFTTPVLFYILWPKVKGRLYAALAICAVVIATPSLFYQNSGWVQSGYRFALDYMPFLMLLIAASGRKFSKLFYVLCVFSVIVNLFIAVTFDRVKSVYPSKAPTAYFEPD